MLASCFYSKVSASSRIPLCPASTLVPRSQGGPFRPRPRRESAHPQRRSLAAHPHTAKHPPWPRSTRFARSAPYGTGRLTAAAQGHRRNLRVYETASTIGHPGTHAQTSSQPRPASPARRTAKGFIYTPKEAAADVAAGCFQGDCNVAKSL